MPCLLRWRMPVHGVAATWVLAITLWASLPVRADWTFTPAVPVSPVAQTRPGVFHHLESAGRKNIAVAGTSVAVIWEDNHTGQPAIYAALRQGDTGGFSAPIPLSAGKQAYEPVIVAAGAEGFIAAWEQDGQVWARTFSSSGAGPALVLDKRPSGQVSLASRLAGEWASAHAGGLDASGQALSSRDDGGGANGGGGLAYGQGTAGRCRTPA